MICQTITWAREKVVYQLASIKYYICRIQSPLNQAQDTSPRRMAILFTYGSDTRGGGMLQITSRGLLYGNEKLKISALALSLRGA